MNNPQMVAFLRGIDLIPQDVQILFEILDTHSTGEIDAETLVSGCLRLHGNAKAFDLACLMEEFCQNGKQMHEALQAVYETMVSEFKRVGDKVDWINEGRDTFFPGTSGGSVIDFRR